jgi:hypothetical protein
LAVLLLGLIALRLWRTLATAITVVLCLYVAGACLFGVDAYVDYALVASNVTWTASNWNGSWFGFFDRFFSAQAHSNWPEDKPLSKALGVACAMLTVTVWLLITHRRKKRDTAANAIDTFFALGLPTTLLASPLGWVYYFPMLTMCGFIAWVHANHINQSRTAHLSLIVPLTMVMAPISLKPTPSPLIPAAWWGIDGWYFYTLITITVVCAMITNQTRKRN